jgi:hypothetical protein
MAESKSELSKGVIFDMFYQKKVVSRAGGGTSRKKMCRVAVTSEDMDAMENTIKQDLNGKKLFTYYTKLKDRKVGIAPPPRPSI